MDVIIQKPAKTAMQSGRAKTKKWVMKPVVDSPQTPDRLMGWQSGTDTHRQIEIQFDTMAAAIKYAKQEGYTFKVLDPKERTFKPKSYAQNFTKPLLD